MNSRTQRKCAEAVRRGYGLVDGVLYGPKGPLAVKLRKGQRYPSFTLNSAGTTFSIAIHKFVAFLCYGDYAFEEGLQVRHRNGDVLDYSRANILMGSRSQNHMDKPQEVRRRCTRARLLLTDDQAREIRRRHAALSPGHHPGFRKGLTNEFGIAPMAISKLLNNLTYKDL